MLFASPKIPAFALLCLKFSSYVRKTAGDLQFVIFVGQVKSLVSFVSGVLYVNWRGSLTRFIHKFYFAQDNYYELNVLQRDIDNL